MHWGKEGGKKHEEACLESVNFNKTDMHHALPTTPHCSTPIYLNRLLTARFTLKSAQCCINMEPESDRELSAGGKTTARLV